MTKNKLRAMRLDPPSEQAAQRLAHAYGISFSELIRRLLLDAGRARGLVEVNNEPPAG